MDSGGWLLSSWKNSCFDDNETGEVNGAANQICILNSCTRSNLILEWTGGWLSSGKNSCCSDDNDTGEINDYVI
ncbi:hypothetical protein QYF36_004108 [Acer negundo]|nr:hypothetical protein QYF36_004108 [Acer negundo]